MFSLLPILIKMSLVIESVQPVVFPLLFITYLPSTTSSIVCDCPKCYYDQILEQPTCCSSVCLGQKDRICFRITECNSIHGQWDNWGGWTDCGGPCDQILASNKMENSTTTFLGHRKRRRHCDSPPPITDIGGRLCHGLNGTRMMVEEQEEVCFVDAQRINECMVIQKARFNTNLALGFGIVAMFLIFLGGIAAAAFLVRERRRREERRLHPQQEEAGRPSATEAGAGLLNPDAHGA